MLELNGPVIRSSFCSADKPQCVQAQWVGMRRTWYGGLGGVIHLTDTKLGLASPVQEFTEREWTRFIHREAWSVTPAGDGMFRVGDLAYTRPEWDAFLDGIAAGEFTPWTDRVAAVT